jgi:ribosomal protein S20
LPDESAIGELTAGGDANPRRRQEAADLIASNEKRVRALSARIVNAQRSQVSKIRNFQRQAKQALDSGDAEGAMTLATKASVLLHDLDGTGGM